MANGDYSWSVLIAGLVIVAAIAVVEAFVIKWVLGMIGYHVGFWPAFGILLLIEIVAGKFRRR